MIWHTPNFRSDKQRREAFSTRNRVVLFASWCSHSSRQGNSQQCRRVRLRMPCEEATFLNNFVLSFLYQLLRRWTWLCPDFHTSMRSAMVLSTYMSRLSIHRRLWTRGILGHPWCRPLLSNDSVGSLRNLKRLNQSQLDKALVWCSNYLPHMQNE